MPVVLDYCIGANSNKHVFERQTGRVKGIGRRLRAVFEYAVAECP
jgi:hypothetical protein